MFRLRYFTELLSVVYESISVCRDPEAKTTQTAQHQAVTPGRVLLGQYVQYIHTLRTLSEIQDI